VDLFYFVSKADHGLSCGNDMPRSLYCCGISYAKCHGSKAATNLIVVTALLTGIVILSFVYIICYQIIKSYLLYGSRCCHVNKDRHAHPHAQARVHTNLHTTCGHYVCGTIFLSVVYMICYQI
jgi:hypothetical protein